MNVKSQIVDRLDRLPPELQEQVLQFVASLTCSPSTGEKGTNLSQFAGSLDSASANEMRRAIEQECERVDAADW
jgi:hypothetical protein